VLRFDGFGSDGGAIPPASTKFKTMEQLLISVDTFLQREKIVKVLESAENEGELDFPFDLWKLHHREYRDPLNPDVTA